MPITNGVINMSDIMEKQIKVNDKMFDCISTHSRCLTNHSQIIEKHRKTLMIILGIQMATLIIIAIGVLK